MHSIDHSVPSCRSPRSINCHSASRLDPWSYCLSREPNQSCRWNENRAKMNAHFQRSRSIPSLKFVGSFFLLLGHIALYAFFRPLPTAAQGQSAIQMMVHDEAGKPVRNVEAHVKRNDVEVRVSITNEQGEVVFPGLSADEYELTVSKPGFESLSQSVVIDPQRTAGIEFTLIPKLEIADRVEVQASVSTEAEQTSSAGTSLSAQEVYPNRSRSILSASSIRRQN